MFTELQDQVFEFETRSKSLTTGQLKDKLMGFLPISFFDFGEKMLADYLAANKIGTHDKNKSVMKKLRKYNRLVRRHLNWLQWAKGR